MPGHHEDVKCSEKQEKVNDVGDEPANDQLGAFILSRVGAYLFVVRIIFIYNYMCI